MLLRIVTFNLENLDDGPDLEPTLADRIRIMRPQLLRLRADVLCFQEVHSQGPSGARTLAALDALLAGTDCTGFHRETTLTTGGELYGVQQRQPVSCRANHPGGACPVGTQARRSGRGVAGQARHPVEIGIVAGHVYQPVFPHHGHNQGIAA